MRRADQSAFDFDAKPPVLLDLAGHKYWASFGRAMFDCIVGKAAKEPENVKAYAEIAAQWEAFAGLHQAKAAQMEGK